MVSLGSNTTMYIKGKRDVHTISLWYQFCTFRMYFIPEKIQESFAQDVDPAEANILAVVVQKPFNQ